MSDTHTGAQDLSNEGTIRASRWLPLVVDLDGTLISADLLQESASAYLARSPWTGYRLAAWLRHGKARLKLELAKTEALEPEFLPYREDLLDWLREEHRSGRQLVLASASPIESVRAVADYLQIFDDVLGTDGMVNLRAYEKRDLLVQRFGAGNYEYVGNDKADLVVWEAAAAAHVVTNSARFLARVRSVASVGRTFASPHASRFSEMVRSLRPHQWAKNVLVLVPMLAAQLVSEPGAVADALLAFVAFCLVASSVYVLNDLVDIGHDRHHPHKKGRPFASGQLSVLTGWVMWPALAILGLCISLFLPLMFTAVLVAYLILTACYSFSLKRVAVVDIVVLALLYTLRLIAGAAAVSAPLSMWLLTFSMFFFLSLASVKRVSELARLRSEDGAIMGRGYQTTDLEMLSSFGVSSAIASIVVFALYVNDPKTSVLYEAPEILWLSAPVMLMWVLRIWLLAHRGQMNEDPILFAVRDRNSLTAAGVVAVVFLLAKVVTW